jgi:hypothetical protein
LRIYPQRNCLDRETALRLWTENVTWFSNEEGKKGRIQVGQFADLCVPDRDYFACAESEIADIASDLTIVGYDRSSLEGTLAHTRTLKIPFSPRLPRRSDISSLRTDASHQLTITATDGTTPPVSVASDFTYQGEQTLVIDAPPAARIDGAPVLECDGPGGASATLDGNDSVDDDSTPATNDDITTFEWLADPGQPGELVLGTGEILHVRMSLGNHMVGLRVTDSVGASDVAVAPITVRDSTPPVLQCPPGVTAECPAQPVFGSASATDLCDPAPLVTETIPASYPLGTTMAVWRAIDASGNPATCNTAVTVRDTTPPTLTVLADMPVLWPPNHELVPVNIAGQVRDLCDPNPQVALVSVTSSEPDDAPGTGDGNTTGDIAGADLGTADTDVDLRAERNGSGTGRVYQMTYRAVDASGNSTPAFAVVTVPHDQGSGPEPLLMRLEPDRTPGMVRIYWAGIPAAIGYDVISGDLSQAKVENGQLSLGAVRVLARGTTETLLTEDSNGVMPATGTAIFYLVQSHTDRGGGGYGTESAPWPRVPALCDGGCP